MHITSNQGQRGFSLIEIMVAIAISLILLAGIIQLFSSNRQGFRIQEGFSLLNENARYAISRLQYDLRMADHWGGVDVSEITSAAPAITDDCSAGFATDTQGLLGLEGGATAPAAVAGCLDGGNYIPNSDVIVVRYADPKPVPTASLVGTDLYVRSSAGRRGLIFQGSNSGSLPSDLAIESPEMGGKVNLPYHFMIYFLRECTASTGTGAGVCLAKRELDGTGLSASSDVIEGVEQLQVVYGIDENGNLNADIYRPATDIGANDWGNVVTARIDILVRSPALDLSIDQAGETYDMAGGFTYTVPNSLRHYPRKLYSKIIQVRNQIRS